MNLLTKFWGLSPVERVLLAEACFWLGAARLAIKFLPFRVIKLWLGKPLATPAGKPGAASPAVLARLSWAVAAASRHLPWECLCLAQAMAGKIMLQCRGIPSTLYMGLARDEETRVKGHAWLTCGEQVLLGRQGMEGYKVIATFAGDAK